MFKVDPAIQQAFFLQFPAQFQGREMNRLIPQAECAPVNDHQFPGAELFESLYSFLGVHVAGRHEPARLVGAQVDDGQIQEQQGHILIINYWQWPSLPLFCRRWHSASQIQC
jgi:hypothetical protein